MSTPAPAKKQRRGAGDRKGGTSSSPASSSARPPATSSSSSSPSSPSSSATAAAAAAAAASSATPAAAGGFVPCDHQGAEGRIYRASFLGRPAVCKERFAKSYRHPTLDRKLRQARMLHEARCLVRCAREGIDVPRVYFVDDHAMALHLEFIDGWTVKEFLQAHPEDDALWARVADAIGAAVAMVHDIGIVHGDLTTSNMMIRRAAVVPGGEAKLQQDQTPVSTAAGGAGAGTGVGTGGAGAGRPIPIPVTLIDFGLGAQAVTSPEDKAVDLYVLERAMASTHPGSDTRLVPRVLDAYRKACKRGHFQTMEKLSHVRLRGRKRVAFG